MSDIRCSVCGVLLGRKLPDGAVEIKEKGRLVALVKWGRIGCTRCGGNAVLDVVPTRAAAGADQWTVEGVMPPSKHRSTVSIPE